jgi:hypothetical protein
MAETRTSAARMKRLIAQWRTSNESAASFARRHQIPPWTFWYWRRKLASAPTQPTTPTPSFVPVQFARQDSLPVIEIVLRGGERLQVRAGASADLVRAAVSALRVTC